LGAKQANGKYLVFLDDDCEATRDLLQAYSGIPNFSDVKMFGGRIEIKWDEPPADEIRAFERLMGKIDRGNQIFVLPKGKYINGGNMVIDRELFLSIGGMEPDQVKGVLAGSGDVGLCRKVQSLGFDIVWVPKALVYHWQIAKLNGKLLDLMRREVNNGICKAYEEIQQKKGHLHRRRILKMLPSKANSIRRKLVNYFVSIILRKPKTQLYGDLLGMAREYGYACYCTKYLWNFSKNSSDKAQGNHFVSMDSEKK
jgi:GT2 family glycosyltransferase